MIWQEEKRLLVADLTKAKRRIAELEKDARHGEKALARLEELGVISTQPSSPLRLELKGTVK